MDTIEKSKRRVQTNEASQTVTPRQPEHRGEGNEGVLMMKRMGLGLRAAERCAGRAADDGDTVLGNLCNRQSMF